MTLDYFHPIDLKTVIRQSHLIVVAHMAKPFKTLHRMIEPQNSAASPIDNEIVDNWTDGHGSYFIAPRLHYVVDEILYNNLDRGDHESDLPPIEPPIEPPRNVDSPHEAFDITHHIIKKNIYVYPAGLLHRYDRFKQTQEDINISPVYEEYYPQSRPGDGEPTILFLQIFPEHDFQFTVDGAEEGLAARTHIENLIQVVNSK